MNSEPAEVAEHPAFTRAKSLPEPWRSHFPKSPEEAREFVPHTVRHALASRVLAVANTRVECAWCSYVDAVPGYDHLRELQAVLDHGSKLSEPIARALFPVFEGVPYAG